MLTGRLTIVSLESEVPQIHQHRLDIKGEDEKSRARSPYQTQTL
jgi:hypothetical protein